jgi:hypothetical protein
MVEQERPPRCEACGAAGTLVSFGDPGAYRYHCLTCWRNEAERVVVEYAEQEQESAPPGVDPPT